MTATLAPIDQMTTHLSVLFEPKYLIEFRMIGDNLPTHSIFRTLSEILDKQDNAFPWFKKQNEAGYGVFFGANPRTRNGGKKDKDVSLARAVFADFDDGVTPDEALRRCAEATPVLPTPAIVLQSGHGTHLYWLFDEPMTDLKKWTGLQKALATAVSSDGVHNPSRVMRLAGFLNLKDKNEPVACVLVDAKPECIYPPSELPAYIPAQNATPVTNSEQVGPGGRNNHLTKLGGALRRQGASEETILSALQTANEQFSEPLPDIEISKTAHSVARYKPAEESERTETIEWPDPTPLAERFLDKQYHDADGELLLIRWRGDFWNWDEHCFRSRADETIDAELYSYLNRCWTIKRDKNGAPVEGPNGPRHRPIIPRASMVREVRAAIPHLKVLVDDQVEPPIWRDGRTEPDASKLIAFSNGLLDPGSGTLHPLTPQFFSTHALPYPYEPDAPEPAEWLKFLNELWPEDPEAISTLQEWSGYVVSPDTSQHKILMLVGPKRGGKGTVARVLTGILGGENVAAPLLSGLGSPFGMQCLLGKPLAIIPDARLSGRADQAIVVERLLSISGEDSITVDRKHRDPVTVRLPTRFMLLTNELPRLADSSGALAGRFIILTLTKSWYGQEDHWLTSRILTERPGIFNWALAGLERLHIRGHFVQPASSQDALQDLEDLGSPVGAFVRERCVIGPEESVKCSVLYQEWTTWCADQGRAYTGSIQTFSRDLKAAVRHVRTFQPRQEDGSRPRLFQGVSITMRATLPI